MASIISLRSLSRTSFGSYWNWCSNSKHVPFSILFLWYHSISCTYFVFCPRCFPTFSHMISCIILIICFLQLWKVREKKTENDSAWFHLWKLSISFQSKTSCSLPGREFLSEVYGPEDVAQNPYMRQSCPRCCWRMLGENSGKKHRLHHGSPANQATGPVFQVAAGVGWFLFGGKANAMEPSHRITMASIAQARPPGSIFFTLAPGLLASATPLKKWQTSSGELTSEEPPLQGKAWVLRVL